MLVRFTGGVPKFVPIHPPEFAGTQTVQSDDWKVDMKELEDAITPKTKMMVGTTTSIISLRC